MEAVQAVAEAVHSLVGGIDSAEVGSAAEGTGDLLAGRREVEAERQVIGMGRPLDCRGHYPPDSH